MSTWHTNTVSVSTPAGSHDTAELMTQETLHDGCLFIQGPLSLGQHDKTVRRHYEPGWVLVRPSRLWPAPGEAGTADCADADADQAENSKTRDCKHALCDDVISELHAKNGNLKVDEEQDKVKSQLKKADDLLTPWSESYRGKKKVKSLTLAQEAMYGGYPGGGLYIRGGQDDKKGVATPELVGELKLLKPVFNSKDSFLLQHQAKFLERLKGGCWEMPLNRSCISIVGRDITNAGNEVLEFIRVRKGTDIYKVRPEKYWFSGRDCGSGLDFKWKIRLYPTDLGTKAETQHRGGDVIGFCNWVKEVRSHFELCQVAPAPGKSKTVPIPGHVNWKPDEWVKHVLKMPPSADANADANADEPVGRAEVAIGKGDIPQSS
eukprot:TRINITY_DN2364_c0_g1_i1.p1 TRINITY_DN2364_c0_g1~~TRINITY_DN2364_c0_g1_i1.p1  ORF type:complete len:377 (-),score=57.46 TRINITY_DN2364_c0_g1_i1:190-1320(-)